jgi:Tfp pilus assembly protein PilV
LLKQFDESTQTLASLENIASDGEEKETLLADRVELLLAQSRAAEALSLLANVNSNAAPPTARRQFLRLAALLQQAERTQSDKVKNDAFRKDALSQLRQLQQQPASVWTRRGELLTAASAGRNTSGTSQELMKSAETLSRAGDDAKAAELYAKAAKEESTASDGGSAMLLESARAWERAGQQQKAGATYCDASRRAKDPLAASDALLRAAAAYRRSSDAFRRADALHDAEMVLQEHRRRFPTLDQGEREWLTGETLAASGRWLDASQAFVAIAKEDPRRGAALLMAVRCRFQEVRRRPQASEDAAAGAVDFLQKSLAEMRASAPEATASLAEANLYLAELLLDPRVGRPAEAEEALRELLTQSPPHDVLLATRRWLIVALALQPGKESQGEQAVAAMSGATVDDLAQAMAQLHLVASIETEPRREAIGKIERRLLEEADRRGASSRPESRVAIETARVLADWQENDPASAARIRSRLEALRVERPRDPLVIEALALAAIKSRRYEAASAHWQSLTGGLPKGSPAWYRAQLNWIVCLRRTGRMKQALHSVETLEVLHPQLGGPILRRRFEDEKRLLTPS